MLNMKDSQIYKKNFEMLINIFPERIKNELFSLPNEVKTLAQEIRVSKNIRIICGKNIIPLEIKIAKDDMSEIFKKICGYSVYSFEDQLKDGFITFKGGNRIGIASSAVLENGKIKNIKDVTSLNIRICKEIKGCSEKLWQIISGDSLGSLIVGCPSSGKTTLLRDLARIISKNKKVSIIDERGEIAGAFESEICMDVGSSDVLTGFPKAQGILRAIRCLSPEVIICDEIGSLGEATDINEVLNSGVKIISSIHAKNQTELLLRPQAVSLLKSGAFERVITLSPETTGEISGIFKVEEILKHENHRSNFSNPFGDFCGNVLLEAKS